MEQFGFKHESLKLTCGYKDNPQLGEREYYFQLEKTQTDYSFSTSYPEENVGYVDIQDNDDRPYTEEDIQNAEAFAEYVAKEKGLSVMERLYKGLDNRPLWKRLDFWAIIVTVIGIIVTVIACI